MSLAHVALTVLVFVATLALVLKRPRGTHEALWTTLGALAMLVLGLVSPRDVVSVAESGKEALLFLLALLLLSALLEKSGFFEWAAVHAARAARGDGRALYRNVFILGALITAALSLDTTAVILTPLVLAFVRRLRLPARPYVFACAFIANTASLPLPVSNLTNLLFASTFHFSFHAYAARMILPQLVALAANYALFRRAFRDELPPRFDPAELPDPESVVPHRGYFRAATAALGVVLIGYFVAPHYGVTPYAIAFALAAPLFVYAFASKQASLALFRELSWGVFPFVLGLFVVVRAVDKLGLTEIAAAWLTHTHLAAPLDVLVPAGATAVASNLINNLPAALLARGVLTAAHAPDPSVYGALLGANIGPNITIFGSLATILVLSEARKKGEDLGGMDILRVGIVVTPLVLLAASLVLSATYALVR